MEAGIGSGERTQSSGEWRGAREWRVVSGEWRVARGEWRVASGEWKSVGWESQEVEAGWVKPTVSWSRSASGFRWVAPTLRPRTLATGRPLAIGHWPLATRYSPLATRHSRATRHSPLTTHHSSLARPKIRALFVPAESERRGHDGLEPGGPGLVGDVVEVELGVGPVVDRRGDDLVAEGPDADGRLDRRGGAQAVAERPLDRADRQPAAWSPKTSLSTPVSTRSLTVVLVPWAL